MHNSWDKAAAEYLKEWTPRFAPYHRDLLDELAIDSGERVLVVGAGPGVEAIAAARSVGATGRVRATDASAEMVRLAKDASHKAGVEAVVEHAEASLEAVEGGPWNSIVAAFALWELPEAQRQAAIGAWASALAPHGKLGLLTWGPHDDDGAFAILTRCLRELDASLPLRGPNKLANHDVLNEMVEQAGLTLVRYRVVRHIHTFTSAEAYLQSLRSSCAWRERFESLGEDTIARAAARFYDQVGGPDAPLVTEPAATLAVAARPGEEVRLRNQATAVVPPPVSKSRIDVGE